MAFSGAIRASPQATAFVWIVDIFSSGLHGERVMSSHDHGPRDQGRAFLRRAGFKLLELLAGFFQPASSVGVSSFNSGRPVRSRSTFSTRISQMRRRKWVLPLDPEMCGVRITFGSPQRGWSAFNGYR